MLKQYFVRFMPENHSVLRHLSLESGGVEKFKKAIAINT